MDRVAVVDVEHRGNAEPARGPAGQRDVQFGDANSSSAGICAPGRPGPGRRVRSSTAAFRMAACCSAGESVVFRSFDRISNLCQRVNGPARSTCDFRHSRYGRAPDTIGVHHRRENMTSGAARAPASTTALAFLGSEFAGTRYLDWPTIADRGHLRHTGQSRLADTGDKFELLLDRVMLNFARPAGRDIWRPPATEPTFRHTRCWDRPSSPRDVGDREVGHRRRRRGAGQRRDLIGGGCRAAHWRAGRCRGCRSWCRGSRCPSIWLTDQVVVIGLSTGMNCCTRSTVDE